MNAPWALGESEAPRGEAAGRRAVAPDAPTPRDLARANASRNAGDKDSRANFFTGGGAQAPASTGKRQFGLSSQTSSGFDRRAVVSGAKTRAVVRCDRRAGPVRHPRQRRARLPSGARSRARPPTGGRKRQRRPERGQLAGDRNSSRVLRAAGPSRP